MPFRPLSVKEIEHPDTVSVTFNELIRLLESHGFRLVRQKGSVRYYGKPDWPRLVRVDYHGSKQVPKGTLHAILKAAGISWP